MTKHFVAFTHVGSFFSEESTQEIPSRELFLAKDVDWPRGAYCYQFFDREEVTVDGETLVGKPKNKSPNYFRGEIFDKERVKREVQPNTILLSNMENNGWQFVVKAFGRYFTMNDGDVVVCRIPE